MSIVAVGCVLDAQIPNRLRKTIQGMLNQQNQTSYHLVFGTSHPSGMEVFKRAAWRVTPDGLFRFADLKVGAGTGFLHDLAEGVVIGELKGRLLDEYSGRPYLVRS